MECKDVLTRLWEYLDQELASEEAAAIATHLRGCESCKPCCRMDGNFLALLHRQRARVSAPPALIASVIATLRTA
jgi:mycothiol system anti-sigma-R factor